MTIFHSFVGVHSRALLGVLLGLGALTGCGGGGDDEEEDGPIITVDSFVGSWSETQGEAEATCTAEPDVTITLSMPIDDEPLTVNRGTQSDLVVPDDGCSLSLNVSGTTAQLTAPADCSFIDEEDGTAYTFTVQTYTLTSNGAATLSLVGTGVMSFTDEDTAYNCTVNMSAQFARL